MSIIKKIFFKRRFEEKKDCESKDRLVEINAKREMIKIVNLNKSN